MSRPNHIFLIGFMGAGKTSVGRLLAQRCSMPYVDLDEEIERDTGVMVSEIFAERGEAVFREIETHTLLAMSERPRSVVACGGGVVMRPENRSALNSMGTVVYLMVSAPEALARIGDLTTRPLLAGPAGALAATSLLAARESLYSSVADIRVDTAGRTPQQVADVVVAALTEE